MALGSAVGNFWRESTPDSGYRGLSAELYAVTDAEYILTSQVVLTTTIDFSAVAFSAPVKLIKLINTDTNKVIAFISTNTGLCRSYNFPPTDVGYAQFLNRTYTYDCAMSVLAQIAKNGGNNLDFSAKALAACSHPTSGGIPFSVNILSKEGDAQYRTGSIAWCVYALGKYCLYRNITSGAVFDATVRSANWMLTMTSTQGIQAGSLKGGTGRYVNEVFDPAYVIPWAASEHNIDAYFTFLVMRQLTGLSKYLTAAKAIETNLMAHHWNASQGYFYQGISDATTVDTSSALDCMSWGSYFLLATGRRADANRTLARMRIMYAQNVNGVDGFPPYIPADGYSGIAPTIWCEGTLGAAMAFYRTGKYTLYRKYIAEIAKLRKTNRELPYVTVPNTTYELTGYDGIIGVLWDILARTQPAGVFSEIAP